MREEGAADDEVILFTEVNYSFSIVCEVTYSMFFNASRSVLVDASYPCINVSKQEHDVVTWNVVTWNVVTWNVVTWNVVT